MRFLLIETSTERGVIALVDGAKTIFTRELPLASAQSKHLMPYLEEELQKLSNPLLDAIGVGVGPGSYTGIRMGVAVAQALAYSWNVPLVGISSLNGFIPDQNVKFAAVLDARIGGIYFRKGWRDASGIHYESAPQICAISEAVDQLQDVTHLITPVVKNLQAKFKLNCSDKNWEWIERPPSILALVSSLQNAYLAQKNIVPPAQIEILYLRKTEAERQRENPS